MRGNEVTKALCLGVIVATLAACTTSTPASVNGLRQAIGNALPGAQGKTLADQDRIDETVARGCGSNVYTKTECQRHTAASAQRRSEIAK